MRLVTGVRDILVKIQRLVDAEVCWCALWAGNIVLHTSHNMHIYISYNIMHTHIQHICTHMHIYTRL